MLPDELPMPPPPLPPLVENPPPLDGLTPPPVKGFPDCPPPKMLFPPPPLPHPAIQKKAPTPNAAVTEIQ
jgi:hypothetical protein